ncbi:VOC family protein [Nisaea acidiphila]|uniref:VOC family protein n=1 Tax=Nisaea acidiphila TaxID=1862145 RepID=A0A9J7ALD4_9PROT|nr:VOC family protein [Nisaea acidiphila]UUX48288.1 VOC family protein [Nisaea acidiphila]
MKQARQLPGGDEIFLDHVAHFVPDMAEAHRDLNRLGFVQTPYTEHRHQTDEGAAPAPSGTANRCIMLPEGYIEVIAVSDAATELGKRTQGQIDRYVGLHLIAFSCVDPESVQGRLTLTGFHPQPLVHLKRPVTMPNGGEEEAAFTVCRVRPQDMPEGRVQYLAHHTEEIVWQDRWMQHGNGIVALRDVVIGAEVLDKTAARYCWFLDRGGPKPVNAHIWRIPLDRGGVVIADEEGLGELLPNVDFPDEGPLIAGYGVLSADLSATESFFRERGFAPERIDNYLELTLPESLGGTLFIAEEDTDFPWMRQ